MDDIYVTYSVDLIGNPKYRKRIDSGRKACKAHRWDFKVKKKQGEEGGKTTQHTAKH